MKNEKTISFGKAVCELAKARDALDNSHYGAQFKFCEELYFHKGLTPKKIEELVESKEKYLQYFRDTVHSAAVKVRDTYMMFGNDKEVLTKYIDMTDPSIKVLPPSTEQTVKNIVTGRIIPVITSLQFQDMHKDPRAKLESTKPPSQARYSHLRIV